MHLKWDCIMLICLIVTLNQEQRIYSELIIDVSVSYNILIYHFLLLSQCSTTKHLTLLYLLLFSLLCLQEPCLPSVVTAKILSP